MRRWRRRRRRRRSVSCRWNEPTNAIEIIPRFPLQSSGVTSRVALDKRMVLRSRCFIVLVNFATVLAAMRSNNRPRCIPNPRFILPTSRFREGLETFRPIDIRSSLSPIGFPLFFFIFPRLSLVHHRFRFSIVRYADTRLRSVFSSSPLRVIILHRYDNLCASTVRFHTYPLSITADQFSTIG